MAILVTTHYMSEAEHCDDLALMYAGRVIADGAPSKLRTELETGVGIPLGLITDDPLRALHTAKDNGFERAALFGQSLRVLAKNPDNDEQRLRKMMQAAKIEVIESRREAATMEDVFVNMVLAQESVA